MPDIQSLTTAVEMCYDPAKHEGKPAACGLGDIVGDLMVELPGQGVVLRGDVAASLGTISLCEALVVGLHPDFDMLGNILPFIVSYAQRCVAARLHNAAHLPSGDADGRRNGVADLASPHLGAVSGTVSRLELVFGTS